MAGFVEFLDAETASSAVRNLNGVDLNGRALRVDHAEPEKTAPSRRAPAQSGRPGGPPGGGPGPMGPPGIPRDRDGLPLGLPTGIPLPGGMSATDSITQTLATMPPEQLLDIMSQMKVGSSA